MVQDVMFSKSASLPVNSKAPDVNTAGTSDVQGFLTAVPEEI